MNHIPDYLLAMDTSGDVCGIALLREGALLAEHSFRHEMHLSERLLDEVDYVLKRAGIALKDIAAFGIGIGPGSFTGTRIGVMTVKTFAATLSRPVYGIDGLAALAEPFAGLRDTLVVPILPCRAGVVFTCAYAVEEAIPAARMEPAALALSELILLLKQTETETVHFCGSAVPRYREELMALSESAGLRVGFGVNTFPAAASIARLACQKQGVGVEPDDPLTLVPLYIAPPPITLPKTPIPQT